MTAVVLILMLQVKLGESEEWGSKFGDQNLGVCTMLEENVGVFGTKGSSSILVDLDFKEHYSAGFIERYLESGDNLGEACLKQIKARIDIVMGNFMLKIQQIFDMEKGFQLWMEYPEAEKLVSTTPERQKRAFVAPIAIGMAILNLFGTGASLFYTASELKSLGDRVKTLEGYYERMLKEHKTIKNNIEFLYQKEEFIGVTKKVMVEHFNVISKLHSCDILSLNIETHLTKFEVYLDGLFQDIYNEKFSSRVVNLGQLVELVKRGPFYDTVYQISPPRLYEFGKLVLISHGNNKLSFMVNFPIITRKFDYRIFNIYDIDHDIKFHNYDLQNKGTFLAPYHTRLRNVHDNLDLLRSTANCLRARQFTLCKPNIVLNKEDTRCIGDLLSYTGTNLSCRVDHGRGAYSGWEFEQTRHGHLVRIGPGYEVINTLTNESYVRAESETLCLYFKNGQNIGVKHNGTVEKISREISKVVSRPEIEIMTLKHEISKDLILPEIVTDRPFIHFEDLEKTLKTEQSDTLDINIIILYGIVSFIVFTLVIFFCTKICFCIREFREGKGIGGNKGKYVVADTLFRE